MRLYDCICVEEVDRCYDEMLYCLVGIVAIASIGLAQVPSGKAEKHFNKACWTCADACLECIDAQSRT
jgi:hypothetical protein